ncbi:MAG TPA: universal stress protein [Bacillota bacterium]|nr:universal stress protein [Bacillota bacterium]
MDNLQYKNVVVAVDGSKASEKAFKKSVSIAKRNHSRLIIAHVVDTRTYALAEAYERTLIEHAENHAKEIVNRYAEDAKTGGVENLVRCVEYGSPKVKIPKEIAKTFEADLIICGATGMNAVERLLMGSVSEGIARHATCDVLVVR